MISADQAALSDALRWVALALPTRTPYPALMGIVLKATDSAVELSAYDDLGAHRMTVSVDVVKPGKALIPGALLRDLVAALPSGKLDLFATDHGAELRTGDARYSLPVLPLDDYPLVPDLPAVVGMVCPRELSDALSAVSAAIDDATDTDRRGVHLRASDGALSVAGISPSLVSYRHVEYSGDDFQERMSPGLLSDALRGAADHGELFVRVGHGLVSLSNDGGRRTSVMQTYYPSKVDYRKLFRAEPDPHYVAVDVAELSGALRRVSLLGTTALLSLVVGSPGALRIECDGAREFVAVDEKSGPFITRLNPELLTKAARSMGSAVRLSNTSERSPVILRPVDPALADAGAVIAPMRDIKGESKHESD
jgi:DNA polymerase-3 subunit beta